MEQIIHHYEQRLLQSTGVIGIKKFVYDIWGDTVNVASRMESHGQAGKIQVSEATQVHLQEHFALEEHGVNTVKGKGDMKTYWLGNRLSSVPSSPSSPSSARAVSLSSL